MLILSNGGGGIEPPRRRAILPCSEEQGLSRTLVNRAIAADHGYESQELLGKSPVFLNPPELNAAVLEELNQGMRQGRLLEACNAAFESLAGGAPIAGCCSVRAAA